MPNQKQHGEGSHKRGIELLLLLSRGIPLTRENVFAQMSTYYNPEASPQGADRMFRRDLNILTQLGFTITFCNQQYLLEKGPPSFYRFRSEDVDALALLYTLFSDPLEYLPKWAQRSDYPGRRPEHPFARDIVEMVEEVAAVLPDSQRKKFEMQTKRPFIFLQIQLAGSYLEYRQDLDFLVEAIRLRRQVAFSYLSREETQARDYRLVNPQFIEAKEEQLYLVASMEESERLYFRLDRFVPGSLVLLSSTSGPLRAPRLTTIRFWIRRGLLSAQRQDPNLRVSERWRSQTIMAEACDHQWLLVEVETDDLFRARKYFLSLGSQVIVISPTALVTELREEIARMAQFYPVEDGQPACR